jgi:hypothetical protein
MRHGALEVRKVMKNTKRDNMGSITEHKRHRGIKWINKKKASEEHSKLTEKWVQIMK